MGNIKDIVDLAIQLEGRVKDRKDIETLRSIISLTQAVQASDAEIVERDVRVMQENAKLVQENAELQRQLAASQAEDIRIHKGIEFRCGKRTGNKWQAFCPKCHMPAQFAVMSGTVHGRVMACSGRCGWNVFSKLDLEQLIGELEV
jgi:hypothetical protein